MNRYLFSCLVAAVWLLSVESSAAQKITWEPVNGPYGGNITSFVRLGSLLLARAETGYLYRSLDSGTTWKSVGYTTDKYSNPILPSGIVAWGSTLVGFGRYNYGPRVYSTDSGSDWLPDTLPMSEATQIIATDSAVFLMSYSDGIFRSIDTGHSWNRMPIAAHMVSAMAGNGPVIYVYNDWGGGLYGGLFRSLDNGDTWNKVDTSLAQYRVNLLSPIGSTLFAATEDSALYRSQDSGVTWSKVGQDIGDAVGTIMKSGSAIVLVTRQNTMYRSSDDGRSWTYVGLCPKQNDGAIIEFGGRLIAGSDYGISISTNTGNSWGLSNQGLTALNIHSLETRGDALFAATEHGMYRSDDRGDTWTDVNGGASRGFVYPLHTGGPVWYVGFGGGLFQSIDSGHTWDSVTWSLPHPDISGMVKLGPNIIVGTSFDGTCTSTDDGNTWLCPYDTSSGGKIENPATVYFLRDSLIARAQRSIYSISTNFGETWIDHTVPQSSSFDLFAMDSSIILFGNGNGLYRSLDTGATWKFVIASPPSAIEVTGNRIYISSSGYGISYSPNHGVNWRDINDGLPDYRVSGLAVGESEMYANLTYGGIYRAEVNPSSVQTSRIADGRGMSLSVYPNPVSDAATIRYDLAEPSSVSIALFDALGREAARPIDGVRQIDGEHELEIQTDKLIPGMYTCRLSADGEEQFIKLLVIH